MLFYTEFAILGCNWCSSSLFLFLQQYGSPPDGCAIFFKTKRFALRGEATFEETVFESEISELSKCLFIFIISSSLVLISLRFISSCLDFHLSSSLYVCVLLEFCPPPFFFTQFKIFPLAIFYAAFIKNKYLFHSPPPSFSRPDCIVDNYINEAGGMDNQGHIILHLTCKYSDRDLLVATTHLKAKTGRTNELTRRRQALQLLDVSFFFSFLLIFPPWNIKSYFEFESLDVLRSNIIAWVVFAR